MSISQATILIFLSVSATLLLLTPQYCMAKTMLFTGQKLEEGEYLTWGPYKLVMEDTCDLILYEAGESIWHTNTYHFAKHCYLTLKNNGNLVMYSGQRQLWQSDSYGPLGNYVFVLQENGDLAIYGDVMWTTNTNVVNYSGVSIDATLNNGTSNAVGATTTYKNPAGMAMTTMSK